MAAARSSYAEILNDCKIMYMPSCLIVEMMTKLYSQVSKVNLSGVVQHIVPDLVILLRRLTQNLRATADAYQAERIRFFIGDWKSDKLRARRLFFNLMSRLGYLCDLFGSVDRKILFESIEEMTAEWTALDKIMEEKCGKGTCMADCCSCRYFRSDSVDNWQAVMGKTILELDATAEYPNAETYLILLCYERVGKAFVNAIETLQRRKAETKRFSPKRILCVSNDDVFVSCPKCGMMTETFRRGNTEAIRKDYEDASPARAKKKYGRIAPRKTELRGRYPMPPSLAGIAR